MATAATMSRRAMLMTLGACIVEEGSQSVNEACTVALDESTPCNQAPPPTPPPAQQTTTTAKSSPRDQKRKAYYYNNLEPNNKNRARPSNKANKLSQRRLGHEERIQPYRSTEEPWSDLQSRTIHAQSSFSANSSSQRQGGALYTGQIAHITNNYYYVTPEQVGPDPVSPAYAGQSHVHRARAAAAAAAAAVCAPPSLIEMQAARSMPSAIRMPFAAEDSYGHAAASQAEPRPRSQMQPQPQQHGTVAALAQQQAFGTNPRSTSLFGTSPSSGTLRHVGVEIVSVGTPRYKMATQKSSSSVGQPEPDLYEHEVEPRPIKRTQTVPIRCFPDCSKSL